MGDRDGVTRLAELTWREAADWFGRDPRLLLPVASLLQHGPHLPLHTDAVIVTALAEGIAARRGVLLAPTLPFGCGSEIDRAYAGSAGVGHKTLHRLLNDLVSDWESHGLAELVLLTTNGFGPNYRALVSVIGGDVKIRAVDTNVVDVSPALRTPAGPERGGEVETSLMMYLAPGSVRREEMKDVTLERSALDDRLRGTEPVPLPGSIGVLGRPTAATAEKGKRIYEYLVRYIADRLFSDVDA